MLWASVYSYHDLYKLVSASPDGYYSIIVDRLYNLFILSVFHVIIIVLWNDSDCFGDETAMASCYIFS